MNENHTIICRGCGESVMPQRIEVGPNRRETLGIAFFGLLAWLSYCLVDTWKFRCPSCGHQWRPRLRDLSFSYRLFAALVAAGAIVGFGTLLLLKIVKP